MNSLAVRGSVCVALLCAASLQAGSATFRFNGNLSADEAGVPDLVAVDPLSGNGFETATVLGETRTVYRWDGNRTPLSQQAGLLFDSSSVVTDPTNYTLELVFAFTEDTGTWRAIFNTQGRMADQAFYVEPGDRLQVYNDVTGSTHFTTGDFHYIAMTVKDNNVLAFFDGVQELNSPTDELNITNPIVALFVDNNLGGPAQTEFADGKIALFRMQAGAVSPEEIARRAEEPFKDPTPEPHPIPLPAAFWAGLPALALAGALRARWLGRSAR